MTVEIHDIGLKNKAAYSLQQVLYDIATYNCELVFIF